MAHRIDAEHNQEGGHGAVVSPRPGTAAPAASVRPATRPVPLRPAEEEPQASRKPIWDKNNYGFWLSVCIVISLLFSLAYRALA